MGLFLRDDARAPLTSSAARHRAAPAAWNTLRPITASAERISISGLATVQRPYSTWQSEAWNGYERVGEIHYGFNLLANLLSRVRIYAAIIGDANEAPTDLGSETGRKEVKGKLAKDALDIMSELHASDFSGLVRSFSLNLSVPGECYLIRLPSGVWTIRSVDELQIRSTGYLLVPLRGATTEQVVLPPDTYVARIWRQSPRYSREPDSSMVGVSESIEELLMLTRLVRGAARSRMNAGMLFIPDGLATIGAQPTAEPVIEEPADPITALQNAPTQPTDGGFLQQLMESMTTPISDEGSAAGVVPMLTTGPAELGAAIRHITFERSSDEWLVKRADQALERILNGIDIPKEVVTGLESVKYALSVDAEILTRNGWKTYEQVRVGEDVYTLNHETGAGEWQPLLEINIHDHDGPMLRIKGAAHDSLSTPEHRWPVVKEGKKVAGSNRRWTTSADGFTSTDRITTAATCSNLVAEPKWTDDMVQLVALYSSDGWLETPERGGLRANVTKTNNNRNPQAIAIVRGLMDRIDPEHREFPHTSRRPGGGTVVTGCRFRMSTKVSDILFSVVEGKDKITRLDFITQLTLSQLTLFLDTLIEIGDGNIVNGNPLMRRYWQSDKRRLEPIAIAGVLSGWAVRWLPKPILPSGNSLVQGSRPCWGLTVSKARTQFIPYSAKHSWEDYKGKVWCPTTKNHTWLARMNGACFYTGNSNAVVIDENLYKSNIEPLGLVFVDALTSVYLKPRLKSMGYTDEDLSHIVVWYDPSEIVTRPNSADEATQGIDRMLLSPAAWRREHGYAETDAPSEAELATLLMMRISTIPDLAMVELMKQALPNLFGKIDIPLADPLAGNHNIHRFPQAPEGNVTDAPKVSAVPRDIQKAATRQVGLK